MDVDHKRLYWHSRRGMRELDLLLLPFVEHAYAGLAPDDQTRYQALLDCEDQDLFAYFMRRETPPNPELQRIVQLIIDHSAAVDSSQY